MHVIGVENRPLTHTKSASTSFISQIVEHEMVQFKGQGNDEMPPCPKSS